MEELTTLIERARNGDRAAYDRIVRRFQDRAVGYGYSVLRDFALAEDAAQEAFLQAFHDLPTLEEPAAFPGWLRRIVFKYCDRMTRRGQLPLTPLDTARETPTSQAGPAHVLEAKERTAQVRAAIEALPEAERAVVTLFYLAEHSQQEIAEFLQVPVTTVKKRLQRGRTLLKERMLTMVHDTLRENAPSRDRRFVEVADLLRRITDLLEQDTNVVAAYLDHFGNNEGFGADDDAWSSLNVHVVVRDEHLDTFATKRLPYAAKLAEPLLHVEAPQNAPSGGYYLMVLYDGEAGPYEVDWYWHGHSRTTIPRNARPLFDRVGLPVSDQPTAWGFLSEDEFPPAFKQARAAMTEAERRADEGRNRVSGFWAMWLITAKYVARNPHEEQMGFLPMLRDLLRDTRQFVGQPAEASVEPPHAAPAEKGKLLRALADEMEALMPQVARQGAAIPVAIVPRAHRFLDLIEATLQAEG